MLTMSRGCGSRGCRLRGGRQVICLGLRLRQRAYGLVYRLIFAAEGGCLRLERVLYVGVSCLVRVGRSRLGLGLGAGRFCFRSRRLYVGVSCLVPLAPVRGGTSFLCPTATKKQKQRKRLQTPALR